MDTIRWAYARALLRLHGGHWLELLNDDIGLADRSDVPVHHRTFKDRLAGVTTEDVIRLTVAVMGATAVVIAAVISGGG